MRLPSAADRHAGLVYAPVGKTIAIMQGDFSVKGKRVQILNADTGAVIHTISTDIPPPTPPSLAWSPDGKALAFSTWRTITVVDAATGKIVHTLNDDSASAGSGMVFSNDGTKLYTRSSNKRVVVEWDLTAGKLLRMLGTGPPFQSFPVEVSRNQAMSLSVSPDGKTLVHFGLEQVPEFIDLATGKDILEAGGHTHPVGQVQFTTDSKSLVTLAGASAKAHNAVHRWDVATGKELGVMALPDLSLNVAASPDGKTLAVASPKRIALLDTDTGKELAQRGVRAQRASICHGLFKRRQALGAQWPTRADRAL